MLKKKVFTLLDVTVAGTVQSGQLDISDSQAKDIVGFAVLSDLPAQLSARGRIGLKSDNLEISPANYPASAFLVGGQNVAPDQRLYRKLGKFDVGAGYIDWTFKDQNGGVAFAAYRVELLVEYEY